MATIIDNIELDETNVEFDYAADFVKNTDKLVYLTGKAGTGKTTFLKYLRETTTKKTVILAPTGVAAVNAGGQTIHSFFQIEFGPYVPNDNRLRTKDDKTVPSNKRTIYSCFQYKPDRLKIIQEMELLIIDEISMVRCDMLDVIDRLLRTFRKNSKPFGGVQMILIGDTFQLPPVTMPDEWNILKKFYTNSFFFGAKVIESNKPIYIELKKIYRQNEQEFIELLNKVRVNQIGTYEMNLLNSKFKPTFTPQVNENYIILATHNRIVESTNLTKLSELKTELKLFEATITGIFPDSSIPTDKVLQLKEGAQIMFVRNNKSKGYYNGTIGKITKIESSTITVELSENNKVTVEKQVWENIKYIWNEEAKQVEREVIGTFTQFPIKLAWAITVHKSQGLTFERVIADLGAAFASGQVYVALSRCTSFGGLVLKTKIGDNAIHTAPEVLKFAENEMPSTLIIEELNAGKADFYYKKTREDIQLNNYASALDNLLKAIKFRNDIGSDIFKRYFIVIGNRLSLFRHLFQKQSAELKNIANDLFIANLRNQTLERTIEGQTKKFEEQNHSIKLVLNKLDELNLELNHTEIENKKLSKKIEELESQHLTKITSMNTYEKEIEFKLSESIEKVKLKSADIEKLKKMLLTQENEIARLKNLKFYQRIWGIK